MARRRTRASTTISRPLIRALRHASKAQAAPDTIAGVEPAQNIESLNWPGRDVEHQRGQRIELVLGRAALNASSLTASSTPRQVKTEQVLQRRAR